VRGPVRSAGSTWRSSSTGTLTRHSPRGADAGWLTAYLPAYAGLILEVAHHHASVWLDGLIGALAVSAVVVGLLVAPIAAAAQGSLAAVATNLAYRVGDVLLVTGVVGCARSPPGGPKRGWMLLGLAFVVLAVPDSVYLSRLAVGSYEFGTPLDPGWLVAFAILGWRRGSAPSPSGWPARGSRANVSAPNLLDADFRRPGRDVLGRHGPAAAEDHR